MLVLTAALFAGCDKNDDDDVISLEVTMANIAGNYKITAVTMTVGTSPAADIFNNPSFYPVCEKDDILNFNTSGVLTVTDAGVACTPSSADVEAYSVNTAAKTITVAGETMTVTTLTSTKMVVQQPDFQGTAGATATITLTRQ